MKRCIVKVSFIHYFIPLKLTWRFENRVVKVSIETGLRSHPSLRAISMPIGLVSQLQSHDELASRSAPFPKLEFPKFDGSNPHLWHDRCEMYFDVYTYHNSLKT